MADTKSKAQACAEWLEYMRFGRTKPEGDKDREAAAELRRLDAVEAERDALRAEVERLRPDAERWHRWKLFAARGAA